MASNRRGPGLEADWEPKPVIFDELYVDDNSGKLNSLIEVVDGRWGASPEISEEDESPPPRNAGRRRSCCTTSETTHIV